MHKPNPNIRPLHPISTVKKEEYRATSTEKTESKIANVSQLKKIASGSSQTKEPLFKKLAPSSRDPRSPDVNPNHGSLFDFHNSHIDSLVALMKEDMGCLTHAKMGKLNF